MDCLQMDHISLLPVPATQFSTKTHIRATVQRHPLLALAVIMFVSMWSVLSGQAFESHGPSGLLPFHIPPLLGILVGWALALAAVIVTPITQGRDGLGRLARRVSHGRVHLHRHVVASRSTDQHADGPFVI